MAEASERSLQILAAALEKEEKGRDFYRDAATKCSNHLAKELFRVLTSEEGIHITRIKEIYTAIQGGRSWTDSWKAHRLENVDLQNLLRERAAKMGAAVKGDTSELDAVGIGIGMEEGAIAFYVDQLAKAVDPLEKEFVNQMIGEERSHLRSLEDLKLFLTDPESWNIERERHGLDGA
jgi:rubrerythrin